MQCLNEIQPLKQGLCKPFTGCVGPLGESGKPGSKHMEIKVNYIIQVCYTAYHFQ